MSFRNAAQKSAHDYYDFLSEHDKSTVTYHIHDILPFHDSHNKNTDIYWLVLERALKSIEGLNIQIDGKIYNETQIKPLSFDENNNYLKVSLASEYKDIFQSIDISKVTVVVDLKFLVKRVEDWYLRYGDRIQLPTQTSSVTYYPLPKLLPPSEDQRAAIEGVLSVPFSYVWGAPGTGKTKCVLSQTVLTYLREKKKILVVAPTNNAVEQTLYGLIEQMTHAGYSQKDVDELVVRMGMATPRFYETVPQHL